MSPALSRSTSIRSLPCWIERWFSFSARLVLGVPDLVAVPELAAVEPEEGDVADVGSERVLNTRPTSGASTGGLTSAGDGSSSTIFLSRVRSAVGQLAAAAEERDDLARRASPASPRR